MNEAIEGLKGIFNNNFQKNLEDFLGCNIHQTNRAHLLTQRIIIDKLIKEINREGFSDKYKTPSEPRSFLSKVMDGASPGHVKEAKKSLTSYS